VSPTGPADPWQRDQWRRARRQVARSYHPDRGGESGEYLTRVAQIDRSFGVGVQAGHPVPAGRLAIARRLARTGIRRSRKGVRAFRARLPRRVPGARRYIDL
jgi:hypothetical protein